MTLLETILQFTVNAGAALDAARTQNREIDIEADDRNYYRGQAMALCDAVRVLLGHESQELALNIVARDAPRAILNAAPGFAYRLTRAMISS